MCTITVQSIHEAKTKQEKKQTEVQNEDTHKKQYKFIFILNVSAN